jgi:hypothetical protein
MTQNQIRDISAKNETTRAQLNNIQQESATHTSDMSNMQKELENRYNKFLSTQQLSVEMQQLYSRQRKLMWIYIVVLVLLLAGISYLYNDSYNASQSVFSESGRASQGSAFGRLGDKLGDVATSAKNAVVSKE